MKLMWFIVFGVIVFTLLNFSVEIYAGKEKELGRNLLEGNNELYIYDIQTKQIEHELFIYALSAYKHNQFIGNNDVQKPLVDERWNKELIRVEEQSEQALTSANSVYVPNGMQESHEKWLIWIEAVHSSTTFSIDNTIKGIIIPIETRKNELEKNNELEDSYKAAHFQQLELISREVKSVEKQ